MLKDLMCEYALTPAPCGSEKEISELIYKKLTTCDVSIDAHGSIIAHKKGIGDPVLFLTALDTPCMYITNVDKNNFLRFHSVGGFSPSVGTLVRLQNGEKGIIGSETDKKDSYFIDIGNSTKSTVSQYAVPCPTFYSDGDYAFGYNIGKYALISVLTAAALQNSKRDAYFVFAAKTSSGQMSPGFMRTINPSLLIALNVTRANDLPQEHDIFIRQGGGAVLRLMDKSMVSSPDAVRILENTGFDFQREVTESNGIGGTVQKAYGGISAVSLALPARQYGNTDSVSYSDANNVLSVIESLIN